MFKRKAVLSFNARFHSRSKYGWPISMAHFMSFSSYLQKGMWLHCTVKCCLIFNLLGWAGHCLMGDANMTNCRGRGKSDNFTEKHDTLTKHNTQVPTA